MVYSEIVFPEKSVFLVTGGAGFIGSNIVETLLNMGFQVKCLDDLSTGKKSNIKPFLRNSNFEFIEGSIMDYETCLKVSQDVDYVSHQAAWGSVPRSIEMPLLYEEINVRGHLNMLEASKENGVKKFVYASSSSVYGDNQTLPKVEGKEGRVLSPYALTKRINEEYAELYSELYGLDTIGLRYFNVFGKRQDPEGAYAAVIPRFIKLMMQGESPTINGDGEHSRDFTYIENVIQANLKAMASGNEISGKSFNIAYGGRISLNEIISMLNTLLESNIVPKYGPDRPGDIKHSNADIKRARDAFDYCPKWSFEQGLKEAIAWYKENL